MAGLGLKFGPDSAALSWTNMACSSSIKPNAATGRPLNSSTHPHVRTIQQASGFPADPGRRRTGHLAAPAPDRLGRHAVAACAVAAGPARDLARIQRRGPRHAGHGRHLRAQPRHPALDGAVHGRDLRLHRAGDEGAGLCGRPLSDERRRRNLTQPGSKIGDDLAGSRAGSTAIRQRPEIAQDENPVVLILA